MATDLKAKYANTLIRPRVTEKASFQMESNVFTFEVDSKVNKKDVSEAVRAYYKVTPLKIRILKNPNKNVFIRGKKGVKAGVKKAYVYLKKGDKIE